MSGHPRVRCEGVSAGFADETGGVACPFSCDARRRIGDGDTGSCEMVLRSGVAGRKLPLIIFIIARLSSVVHLHSDSSAPDRIGQGKTVKPV